MSIIKEQLGSALSATDLSTDINRETPVDRIAALATVGFIRSESGAVSSIDPSSALGVSLIRLRYGRDRKAVKPSIYLLVQEIRRMKDRKRWKFGKDTAVNEALIARLASSVIGEWLEDRCGACCGRGRIGLSPEAMDVSRDACSGCEGKGYVEQWTRRGIDLLIHGDHDGQVASPVRRPCNRCGGNGQRVTRTMRKPTLGEFCTTCGGTGDRRTTANERALALGVPLSMFQKHWEKCYVQVLWRLSSLDGFTISETRLQLEKSGSRVAPQ